MASYNADRREFLKGTAWMGVAALAAGCASKGLHLAGDMGAPMQGFTTAPLKRVRVGLVGLGSRGMGAAHRLAMIPGTEVAALCEIRQEKVDEALAWYKEKGFKAPKTFVGEEAYKAMCEWDGIDCVYSVTPWYLHAPVAVYAMEHGKHAFNEVPGAETIEECWQLVETAEKTRRHCMMLENCVYGEYEMLFLNLCKKGLLGEIVHGEAGYIHDQRRLHYKHKYAWSMWRPGGDGTGEYPASPNWCIDRYYAERHGNYYPTHGLGPVARCMNINRGDRMEHLVSMESRQVNFENFGKSLFPPDSWQAKRRITKGDMNMSMIKTARGNTILLQHDVMSPRPYDRLNLISGTKGIARGYPKLMMTWEDTIGDVHSHDFFDDQKTEEIRKKYMHPLWKAAGDIAKRVGGHGGMDFLMDLRWSYCLQNGLPLDTDVYDLASWSSLVEVTERSVNRGSSREDIPDFTRGGWRTGKPFEIESVDVNSLNFEKAQHDALQQTV